MKQPTVQTNMRLHPALDNLMEISAHVARESKQAHTATVWAYFFGYADPIVLAKQKECAKYIQRQTKGKRPFDVGAEASTTA